VFWTEFKTAVTKKDAGKILSMTRFPFHEYENALDQDCVGARYDNPEVSFCGLIVSSSLPGNEYLFRPIGFCHTVGISKVLEGVQNSVYPQGRSQNPVDDC